MPKRSGREKINTNGRGLARHRGIITSLEIQNGPRTASITLDDGEASTWKYNITKDNDSSSNAMVSLWIAARLSTPPDAFSIILVLKCMACSLFISALHSLCNTSSAIHVSKT
jgi:hypothetical protein